MGAVSTTEAGRGGAGVDEDVTSPAGVICVNSSNEHHTAQTTHNAWVVKIVLTKIHIYTAISEVDTDYI